MILGTRHVLLAVAEAGRGYFQADNGGNLHYMINHQELHTFSHPLIGKSTAQASCLIRSGFSRNRQKLFEAGRLYNAGHNRVIGAGDRRIETGSYQFFRAEDREVDGLAGLGQYEFHR